MARAQRSLFLLVALTLLLPLVHAQTGTVEITGIRILDGDGNEFRIAPLEDFVTIEVTVNNTGTSPIDGPLTLNLTVQAVNTSYVRYANLNHAGSLEAGNSTTFLYQWSPNGRELGDYKATARMTSPASTQGLVATFSVAETGVSSGSIVDRALSFYWVFGLFLLALILFLVVVAARRS